MAVNVLILMSQFANVLLGGDPDEMLSARAWRLRGEKGWRELCWYLDNASPLGYWKGNYSSHCESCYYEERRRIEKRLEEYGKG